MPRYCTSSGIEVLGLNRNNLESTRPPSHILYMNLGIPRLKMDINNFSETRKKIPHIPPETYVGIFRVEINRGYNTEERQLCRT